MTIQMETIINNIKTLSTEYNIDLKSYNIIEDITNGIVENMTDSELYTYVSNTLASYIYKEPKFDKIAVKFALDNIYLEVPKDFDYSYKKLKEMGILHEKYMKFCETYMEYIKYIIRYNRDYNLDFFGIRTLERSYLIRNKKREIVELPQHLFMREAIQIHGYDEEINFDRLKETYDYLSNLYFTHATPTLFNSGKKYSQLSSCYLLQCGDSVEEMADCYRSVMHISKFAGGIGINISDVRSRGSIIKSTGGKSDGIVQLCKTLEQLGRQINQSGLRLGAIACYIEPWHYDIIDFCELRKNTGDENQRARDLFLGLWVPDLFMKKVERNEDWYLMSPDECPRLTETYGEEFEELYMRYVEENRYMKKMKAKDLYKIILDCQIETGMPYMLYKDSCNIKSNQKNLGTIKNSNLCSEIIEYSDNEEIAVCNLASVCLPRFIKDNKFDFDELGKVIRIMTRNLNKIIDINFYPVEETKRSNLRHRPIGIGVQGLADVYQMLDYSFESKNAMNINKKIFECIYYNALYESNEIAKREGVYETYEGSPISRGIFQFNMWGKREEELHIEGYEDYEWDELRQNIKEYGIRNSLLTCVMPTASTAQLMSNNESIEPYASNIYVRKTLAGDFIVVNKHLIKELREKNLWSEEMYNEIIYDNGSVQKIELPIEIKEKYKTAYEIKQSVIIQQSVDRGMFICQSQSMNIFMGVPDFNKLHNCHMYGWRKGLKTGMYYLRTQPASDAIKFGLDPEFVKRIRERRNNESMNINVNKEIKEKTVKCELRKNNDNEPCLVCSS